MISLLFYTFCFLTGNTNHLKNDKLSLKADRNITFSTNEGTWISLDISPDGRNIIFDLLGDIYTIPFRGGSAKQITSGISYDAQPVYSPDGRKIAFISDMGGSENLWIANFDGSNPQQLSKLKNGIVCSPNFSNDGNYIYLSQQTTRGLGTFEIWTYHVKGGSGLQITKSKSKEYENKIDPSQIRRHSALGVTLSPDDKYLYYSLKSSGRENNAKLPIWQIVQRDMKTGHEEFITNDEGSGMKPKISPDGKLLVYATRYKTQTGLRIKNLEKGTDDWLTYPVTKDDQESRSSAGLFPTYDFTMGGKEVVFTKDGKIFKININNKRITEINFSVDVNLSIGPNLNFPYRVKNSKVESRIIMDPVLSPDGKKIAFTTLLHLYVADIKDGSYYRVTKGEQGEFHPSWSNDGKHLTYVTWEENGGHIWRINIDGKGSPKKLTKNPAFYSNPVFSNNGKKIIALKGAAIDRTRAQTELMGESTVMKVISIDINNGKVNDIAQAEGLGKPHFTDDPDRIYLNGFSYYESGKAPGLVSLSTSGIDKTVHLTIKGGDDSGWFEEAVHARDIRLSPDKKWALAIVRSQLYLVAVPHVVGSTLIINVDRPSVYVKKITKNGADYIGWADKGKMITWAIGSSFYRLPLNDVLNNQKSAQKDDELSQKFSPSETKISVSINRDEPEGTIAYKGAKIITMDGRVFDNGLIIVKNNRINFVGRLSNSTIPEKAFIVDVSGKVIIPGFVDTNAHWFEKRVGIHDRQNWSYVANIAWGITTGLEVQAVTNDQIAYQDLIDAGIIIGPRAYSTGPRIFMSSDFNTKEEVIDCFSRYKDHYRTKNLNLYMVGNRQQRQFAVEAAKELEMMLTAGNSLEMRLCITHAIDGFYGKQRNLPITPIYKDIIELYAQTKTGYTPTLLVTYGGALAEKYFFTKDQVHKDPKVVRFIPDNVIQKMTRRRDWYRDDEYNLSSVAADAVNIMRAGGRVGVGSHGQFQGLGFHWELWALQSGGMTEMEALRAATIGGAEIIGIASDVGSIEFGKLADFIILNEDPLDDIRNTNEIKYVVKNGRLYDGETMDQIWPKKEKLKEFWWWDDVPQ